MTRDELEKYGPLPSDDDIIRWSQEAKTTQLTHWKRRFLLLQAKVDEEREAKR